MNFEELNCVSENVNLDDYLYLYKYVRDNMEHPEWLGTFEYDEIVDILANGGKIWLYYDNDNLVCSVFYIPPTNKALNKHNVNYDASITGSLGPIMVSPDYVGHGYQMKMMKIFNDYVKSLGKKYIFTKVHSDNIYSMRNILKDGYIKVDEYVNERGPMTALLKTLD
jgi:GNAT superfamily N-acetyltransferase